MPTPEERPEGESDLDAAGLAAIQQAMAGLRKSSPQPQAPPSRFTPKYADLESWVSEFFALTFGRSEDGVPWCAQWWDHPEAVLRLDAMWRSWELASLDPVRGMPAWIRQHLDPNLAVLFDPHGPFAACRGGRHTRTAVLPVSPPPPEWWSGSQDWWDLLTEEDA